MSKNPTAAQRSKKMTNASSGQQCTLEIPGACIGGTETTVGAHSPLPEDRNGTKAPDFCLADACMSCHDYLDRRTTLNGEHISEEDQRYYFHRGMVRTLANRFYRGVIK